jgi:hypothetical protein
MNVVLTGRNAAPRGWRPRGDPDAQEPGPTDGAQPVVIMYMSAARSPWIITTA